MDFITGLPKVNEKDCIFMVVDRLTKYAHFFSIPADLQAVQVTQLFFREVFRLHGLPRNIVNDQDGRFVSIIWTELFQMAGIELSPSTSYHPQTNDHTEIVNKWLEGYLRNSVLAQQRAWVKWIHLGEYCYNTTYHMSIGITPFKALYGHEPLSFIHTYLGDSRAPRAKDWLQKGQDILRSLKENL